MTAFSERIAGMPKAFGPAQIQASIALFGPLQPAVDETTVCRDISYGPDARHRLDLFGRGDADQLRPIVIFVHGGGFVGGDKGSAGSPFYSNVGDWARRQGCVGVVMTYRLAPAHPWPAGSEDIDRVVHWLQDNAIAYGGDAGRIVIMGQSAGAAHVAGYLSQTMFDSPARSALRGAILLSGLYDPASADQNPFQAAYYGADLAALQSISALDGLAKTPTPCLYTVAEHDPPDFQRQAALVVARIAEHTDAWPDFIWLDGHNHLTPIHQLNCAGDDFGPQLARFVGKVIGARTSDHGPN